MNGLLKCVLKIVLRFITKILILDKNIVPIKAFVSDGLETLLLTVVVTLLRLALKRTHKVFKIVLPRVAQKVCRFAYPVRMTWSDDGISVAFADSLRSWFDQRKADLCRGRRQAADSITPLLGGSGDVVVQGEFLRSWEVKVMMNAKLFGQLAKGDVVHGVEILLSQSRTSELVHWFVEIR